MTHDYLWDGQGPPDPFVQRLEHALAPSRARLTPPSPRRPWPRTFAVASLLVVVLVGAVVWFNRPRPSPTVSWTYQGAVNVVEVQADRGLLLQTDGDATLTHPDGASALVAKGSRLLVLEGPSSPSLELLHGTIFIQASATSTAIVVTTPGASLRVTPATAAQIRFRPGERGDVMLKGGRIEVTDASRTFRVGAGMVAPLYDRGAGTPFAGSAPAELRELLAKFDSAPHGSSRASVLDLVLARCSPDDLATLWNLAKNALDAAERDRVLSRAAELVKLPITPDDAGFERWWEEIVR